MKLSTIKAKLRKKYGWHTCTNGSAICLYNAERYIEIGWRKLEEFTVYVEPNARYKTSFTMSFEELNLMNQLALYLKGE